MPAKLLNYSPAQDLPALHGPGPYKEQDIHVSAPDNIADTKARLVKSASDWYRNFKGGTFNEHPNENMRTDDMTLLQHVAKSASDHPIVTAAAGGLLGIHLLRRRNNNISESILEYKAVSDNDTNEQYLNRLARSIDNTKLNSVQKNNYISHILKTHPNVTAQLYKNRSEDVKNSEYFLNRNTPAQQKHLDLMDYALSNDRIATARHNDELYKEPDLDLIKYIKHGVALAYQDATEHPIRTASFITGGALAAYLLSKRK